jgi:peptide/nickel transport system permease protein
VSRYVARRTGLSLVVVAGVMVLTFLISHVIPGDPAVSWAGPHASASQIHSARVALGLNRPIWSQIVHYFGGILSGDWGVSIRTHRSVLSDLFNVVPASLELVGASLIIAVVAGIPLGLVSARWHGKPPDQAVRLFAVLGVSMPAFWLALILQLVFSRNLHWFPTAGEYSPSLAYAHPVANITGLPIIDGVLTWNWALVVSSISHLVLPAAVIASYPVGVVTRMVRAKVLETSEETHSQMIRSLGFSERAVLSRFSMRLAWSPVIQVLALVFAYSLANTFLVEAVFDWPGLGNYAAQSIVSLDVPAIAGVTLFVAVVYVILNLVVDVAQAFFDPRIGLK